MSQPVRFSNDEVIDVGATRPRRRRRLWLILVLAALLLFASSRALSIYLSALWFGSLGYSSVYWYIFKLKLELFLINELSSWLFYLSVIILIAAIIYALLAATQQGVTAGNITPRARKTALTAISCALTASLLIVAWQVMLSRYPYLWDDHQSFSGVTYTEANYLLPGLLWVSVALVLAAVIVLINAFTLRRVRILLAGIAIPVLVYLIAGIVIPAYVTSFVVKPNELGRLRSN